MLRAVADGIYAKPWIEFALCFSEKFPQRIFPLGWFFNHRASVIFLREGERVCRSSHRAQPRLALISNLAVRDERIPGTYDVRFSCTGMTSVARRIRKRNVMPPKVSAADQWHEPIIISPRYPCELRGFRDYVDTQEFWNFDRARTRGLFSWLT